MSAPAREAGREPAVPLGELVVQLGRLGGVAQRLLAVHVPDRYGRCRGCTVPGYRAAGGGVAVRTALLRHRRRTGGGAVNARAVLFGLLGIVAAAAAILSFAALRDLALLCGFSPQLAWLLPVVVDAGAAAGSLVWLGGWAARSARRFARALALALLGSSVAANALGHGLAAFALTPPWWVVVIVSAVAPAVLGAVVHLAVLVGRTHEHHVAHPSDAEQTDVDEPDIDQPDVDEQVTGAVGAVSERLELTAGAYSDGLLNERGLSRRWADVDTGAATSPRPVDPVDADGRVVELVGLLETGAPVTGAHAAVMFGCSPRTGRRLLTRAQALAATPAGAPTGTEPELVGAGWPR